MNVLYLLIFGAFLLVLPILYVSDKPFGKTVVASLNFSCCAMGGILK